MDEQRKGIRTRGELGAPLPCQKWIFGAAIAPAHLSRSLYILLRKRRLALATSVTSALTRGVPIDAVSGTQHNLQNRSKSRFVSAGRLLLTTTRGPTPTSRCRSPFFMLFLRYNFPPHLSEQSPTAPTPD